MEQLEVLNLIADISFQISQNPDINLVLNSVLDNIQSVLHANRTSIMFPDENREFLYIKAGQGFEQGAIGAIRVKFWQGIAGYVAATQTPLFLTHADDFARFGITHDPLRYKQMSAISVPIIYKQTLLGVLNLNDKSEGNLFTELDFTLAQIISNQAAIAINNSIMMQHYSEKVRLEQSILIAREIQQHFFPKESPFIDGFEIESWAKTCDETGGDYYDYIKYYDHSLAFVIGDVAGHGIGAALVMASARAALHAFVENEHDIKQVFYKLNNLLESNLEYSNFMTMLILLLDIPNNSFRYISAGHEGPVFYQAKTDTIKIFPSSGLAMGIMNNIQYGLSEPIKMASGDFLMLLTDGLFEVHNKKQEILGLPRLLSFIRKHGKLSMIELKQKLIDFWLEFRTDMPQEDDISLVLIKKN